MNIQPTENALKNAQALIEESEGTNDPVLSQLRAVLQDQIEDALSTVERIQEETDKEGHSRTWYYQININERSDFDATVDDEDYETEIFRIGTVEDMAYLIEAGFMKHSEDVDGLEAHLRTTGVIGKTDIIIERE